MVGNKATLQSRLKAVLLDNIHVYATRGKEKATSKSEKTAGDNMLGFLTGMWLKGISMDIQVEEPIDSKFTLPCAPTVAEKEAEYVPQKFNFAEKFDRHLFQGRVKRNVTYANGRVKNNCDGSLLIGEVIRSKGCIESLFLKKYGINYELHLSNFVEVFLSFKDNKYSNRK